MTRSKPKRSGKPRTSRGDQQTIGNVSGGAIVVQGRNDPRVPYTEAEQSVEKVRAKGAPVWYLRAENEGHGFQRKENADFQFWATTLFLRQTLLR